jgi:hypothetical protein
MLLESLLPHLPSTRLDIAIFVVAILGVVMLIYSQFVEGENRRDLIRMTGAMGVLVYSLSILNLVFIILSFGIFVASLVEFIEIYSGYHHHIRQSKEEVYKYIDKK